MGCRAAGRGKGELPASRGLQHVTRTLCHGGHPPANPRVDQTSRMLTVYEPVARENLPVIGRAPNVAGRKRHVVATESVVKPGSSVLRADPDSHKSR